MKNFLLSSGWSEGTLVDLWSLNHFLFGVIAASACLWLGYNFWPSFFISFALMVIWEIFEVWHDSIFEHAPNMVMDVIIGISGFLLTYYLLSTYSDIFNIVTVFGIALFLVTILAIIGYFNFVQRTGDYSLNMSTEVVSLKNEHDTIDS